MSMGNYICLRALLEDEMASTETPDIGLSHPTVVPTNFEPEAARCPSCGRRLSEH